MDADKDWLILYRDLAVDFDADASLAQGEMRLRVHHRRVGNQIKLPVSRRQLQCHLALDETLALAPVLDDVLDGAHLEVVLAGEGAQVGQARHTAVGINNLANDRRFFQTGQPCQVDAALGMAGAHEHAAFAGTQPVHVAVAADQIGGRRALIKHDFYRAGPIEGGDTGGDAGPGVKFHSQRRDLGIGRGIGHRLEMELVADGRRHGQANHAAGVAHHEVDRLRRRLFRGHDQVAFVLPILVVDQDDHAPGPQFGNGFLDRAKIFAVVAHVRLVSGEW